MPPESVLYDPHSPELQTGLYDIYRRLRDEHPVYHNPERKLWVVTRYDDVLDILQDPKTFSSAGVEEAQALLPMMVFMDDPRHKQLRLLLSRVFTPRRIDDLEPRIRAAARQLLDAFEGGRCEFMREFASQLPSIVICELIGVPKGRREAFLSFTEAMIETTPTGQSIEAPAARIYAEFEKLLAERRQERRDDLMSALLDAEVDGEGLSDQELLGFCFLLVVGGTDTTMNLIGNGAALLAQHPEERRVLLEDPSRIPDAIEEIVRMESPTQALPRRPTRAVEMHGVTIPEASRLILCFGSANHDERVFDAPDSFDLDRERKRHLAFGLGTHHCLGSALARLEGRVAFEELLDRHPDFTLAADSGWVTSRWARCHSAIELILDP